MEVIEMVEKNDELWLYFKNDVTIRNGKSIYKELLRYLEKKKDTRFFFNEVKKVDVTFFQLILSYKKSLEKEGKKVFCEIRKSGEFYQTMTLIGFGAECGFDYELVEGGTVNE